MADYSLPKRFTLPNITQISITEQNLVLDDIFTVPTGSLIIGAVNTSSGLQLTRTAFSGLLSVEQYIINCNGMLTIPLNCFANLAVSHTITSTMGPATIFIAQLNS